MTKSPMYIVTNQKAPFIDIINKIATIFKIQT